MWTVRRNCSKLTLIASNCVDAVCVLQLLGTLKLPGRGVSGMLVEKVPVPRYLLVVQLRDELDVVARAHKCAIHGLFVRTFAVIEVLPS